MHKRLPGSMRSGGLDLSHLNHEVSIFDRGYNGAGGPPDQETRPSRPPATRRGQRQVALPALPAPPLAAAALPCCAGGAAVCPGCS